MGNITRPGSAYRVMFTPVGVHVVEEVDPTAFPRELEPIPVPEGAGEFSLMAAQTGVMTAAADSGARFDVLVVYTAAARTANGGTAAIKNLINLGISETNTAYSNSGIIPRLRLVHSTEISYTESGNLGTDLNLLQNPSDGFMDSVHSLRNSYGADLVKLVVADEACGVAFLMCGSSPAFESSAFSVTASNCITSPYYTFGHELGHNMGSNHAPDDPGIGCGAFSYSFGYKDPQARFRTVMAYQCSPSCPRELHFSNPNRFYMGWVTGTATQNNALSINNVRTVVANFRPEAAPVYEGYLDTANCQSINGWAWNQKDANGAVSVDIFRDGAWVTTVPANIFRQDLLNAGKGNGYHAFGYTPSSSWKDGEWHQASTKIAGTSFELTGSPKGLACNACILCALPIGDTLPTGDQYTVGTQFSSNENGKITKLGFYRASGETGTNTLSLWADTGGAPLRSVTPSCSSTGWCWASISPLTITPGTRYRVGVTVNTWYVKTGCGIPGGYTHYPLTAHQGVWSAGSNVFPNTGSCSNFFVDVRFDS